MVFEDSAYAIRHGAGSGLPGGGGGGRHLHPGGKPATKPGRAWPRLANLVIADYGQLIGRLTPAEDLSQGLGELLG